MVEMRLKSFWMYSQPSQTLILISPGCPRPNSALTVHKSGLKNTVHPFIPDTDITLPSGESLNDFHRAIAKLDAHFTPVQNKDTARAQFDIMEQGELSMAKYYVALRKQAEKCVFPDQDEEIRTKILQWMMRN